jgi:hypothetical protein
MCRSTAQEVRVTTESVIVSQGVGVPVGVVVGSDGRCRGVDDELGSGRTYASQSNGNQEKDLKAN